MDIEDAREILNEAIISEPSTKSYIYISADDINMAIQKVLKTLQEKEAEIEKLNSVISEIEQIKEEDISNVIFNKVTKGLLLGKLRKIAS